MKSLFVLGTDTEVGKTSISSGLIRILIQNGLKVGFMKPFASGTKIYSKKFKSKDTKILSSSAKILEKDNVLNPNFYSIPTAPYLATLILKEKEPDFKKVKDIFFNLMRKYDFIIVEGIGGLMVPLNSNQYISDLIKLFKIPVLLITNNKIGTINHTILTIEMCKKLDLPLYGLIINHTKKIDSRIDKNLAKLFKSITDVKVLGEIPSLKKNQLKNIEKYMKFINVHEILNT